MKWMDELMTKVAASKPYVPTDKVEPHERVIGVAPEHLQRFMGYIVGLPTELTRRLSEKAVAHAAAHENPAHTDAECTEFVNEMKAEINAAREESDLLQQIFWQEIRAEVDLQRGNIGFKEDWQIVTWDSKDEPKRETATELMGFSVLGDLLSMLIMRGR